MADPEIVKQILKELEKKPECPYLRKRAAGDEVYYWCDLSDRLCMVEYNDEECETYNEYLAELESELSSQQSSQVKPSPEDPPR